MPKAFSFGNIQFDVSVGKSAARVAREEDSPFLMAVIGDFSGRANRGSTEPLASRRPVHVDCDNFDKVFNSLSVKLCLSSPRLKGGSIVLQFASLDDLHPDRMLKQAPGFVELMDVRKRLLQPSTASAAVADVQRLIGNSVAPVDAIADKAPSTTSTETNEETMARLLGGTPPSAPARDDSKPVSPGVDIQSLIKGIVGSSAVPNASQEQLAALSAVEAELASQLRGILHHPDFQALEATWRGLDLLVRAYGAEENLRLHILDVSKSELMADLKAQDELASSGFSKTMRDKDWAVLIGAFTFEAAVDEIEVLGRLTKTAALLGAPFLAGASPRFVECDSLSAHPHPDEWLQPMSADCREGWTALRALPEASYLGLVMPRVLLRQPYGKGSDPLDSLDFEELIAGSSPECFLWSCGSFVCGHVMAEAFVAEGWEFTAGGSGELDDLPVFKLANDGEASVQPCAEAWLSERAGERIASEGFMPLLSIRGRGAVRFMSLHSVSQPPGPLSLRSS